MINGKYLKELRRSRHYTLVQLSREIGYTASFLSQIERGLKEPSLNTLRKLSECLEVPMISFFSQSDGGEDDQLLAGGYSIVRQNARRSVDIPGLSVRCEALTPQMSAEGGRFLRGTVYTICAGEWCSEGMVSHTYDECTYVISGKLAASLPDAVTELQEGDCIYVSAETRHNFRNCGTKDCVLLTFSN